ncbi:PepSY domain-containing protein, partial [Fusibacter tunisiensis]
MKQEKILSHLNAGVHEAPVDQLDQVKNAHVKKMSKHDHITKQEHKPFPILRYAAVAAVLFLAVFGYRYQYVTPDSMVYLDVNPSFEISINRAGNVVAVEGLNSEAKDLVDDYTYKGKRVEEVVETLTQKLVESSYIREDQNVILVSVYNKDASKRTAQSDAIEKVITVELEKSYIKPVVLSQAIEAEEVSAKKENDENSVGKTHFVNALVARDPELKSDDLVNLSVAELVKMANEKDFNLGDYFKPSEVEALKQALFGDDDDDDADDDDQDADRDDQNRNRISAEEARKIALNRVNGTIVEFEQDDDDYEIEIELDGKEYKIEINAYTGEIIKFEMDDIDDDDDDDDADDDDDDRDDQNRNRISAEEARKIALNRVNGTIAEFEQDDDDYEIEIELDGKEYKIEINAYTGEIIKFEMDDIDDDDDDDDADDDDDDDRDDQNRNRISAEEARKIALNRVNGTIAEFEQDDDDYEIEIELDGKEYKIEINAYTGAIIKFEMDDDDADDDDDDDRDDQNRNRISAEEARKIALNRVNGTIVEFEQDDDDYEIEIELDGKEYKIEINAYTG